jgi:polyhydroxyalkanoate synthase
VTAVLDVAPTPSDEVLRRGPMRLLRYRAALAGDAGTRAPVPVLLVPSLINRAYVFDLRPGQSLVAHLLAEGLDVLLVDWGVPSSADARLGLGDYALRLLDRAIDGALAATGARAVHLFGYCLGGTLALIHAATAAARGREGRVTSVVALTTPVDLAEPGAMERLTDPRLVDLEALCRAFPVVPGPALWAAFQALDPTGNARKARTIAAEEDEERRARIAAQEGWLADPVPMTARALRDVVDGLYRRNALARGELVLDGRPVRLEDGRAPVLNLIATGDTVVPPAASRALAGRWGGPVETVEVPAGHIGITVGSQAPRHMWKSAAAWLRGRQDV